MKLSLQKRAPEEPGLVGTARVDRRTRSLLSRLQPGDIAVLDHLDLDRATAQRLVDAQVSAVVNAAAFVSGRYPNRGPSVLLDAGVLLVDGLGPDSLVAVRDGRTVRVHDGSVYVGADEIAAGRVLDQVRLSEELEAAGSGMSAQLERFLHESTEFVRHEQSLLLERRGVPSLNTATKDRPVAVVVPGPDHAAELRSVRGWLTQERPALVAVDGAADLLLQRKLRPDVVVLSSPDAAVEDRVSAAALRAAKDVVLVVDRGAGKVPTDGLERLGVRPVRFETGATAEDAALLLAGLSEASLVVGIGVNTSLEDFLDRRRGGLSSTYLSRLAVGPKLVDAAAVPRLYSGRVRVWQLVCVLLAGLIAVAAAIAVTPVGQEWVDDLSAGISQLIDRLEGLT